MASVRSWIVSTLSRISSVARWVWVASDFTSLATTAKPLPASPARAASIVAFSASRLVWLAMSVISFRISVISLVDAARERPISLADLTSLVEVDTVPLARLI